MTSHKTMTLDDEMPWIKEFGEPQDFYDDIGFTLTAETDEHDILVGDFIYFFHGGPERPKSLWLADGLAHSEALDPVANVAIDKTGFGSSFSSHLFTKDIKIWGLGHYDDPMFFVTVEGKDMTFIQSQNNATVKHELLEPWFDPRSGLSMPGRCHTYLKSEEGTLELDVQGIGRAYYPWELKRGYQIMFWILAVGNGTFTYPDGRQVIIKDELVHQEFVKLLVVHQETMAGPVLTSPEGWRARSHG